MTIAPLTHHEILGLIEPFARRGRRADLARSDRLARRLVFLPVDHDAPDVLPAHRETLALDNASPGVFRLTRTLALRDDVQATLWTEGEDPGALLERIDAIPRARQLRGGLALGHRVAAAGALHLVEGSARVDGVTVTLTMPTHRSRRADVALTTALDDPLELPDDLLAVLGWDWSRLDRRAERTQRRWTGSVGLARRDADADAERELERLVRHVATTLAESPARFHERLRAARWVFAFRRALPLLVSAVLIVVSLVFTKVGLSQDSVVRMLIFNAPPLMLIAFFCLREVPRFEWPAPPRPSTAKAWR